MKRKLTLALAVALLALVLFPLVALSKFEIWDCSCEAIALKTTSIKTERGSRTIGTLKKGEKVIVEKIDGNNYYIDYGEYFGIVPAANMSVFYDDVFYGYYLKNCYGYSKPSTSSHYRMYRFYEDEQIALIGRYGNYYMTTDEAGDPVFVQTKYVDAYGDSDY